MVTATLSIGTDAGTTLLIFGVFFLVVAGFFLGLGGWVSSGGGIWAGVIIGIVGLLMTIFGGVGVGQGSKELPDFSKRCRGQIQLSVFKTDRRLDDVKKVGEAIEDNLGCQDAVEVIIQVPFRSPYIEESSLEPAPMKLVPVTPESPETRGKSSVENGAVTAP